VKDPGEPGVVGVRRPAPLLNVANGLTAVRIIMVPLFVALVAASGMQRPGWRWAACVAFAVASATDYADGWIARTWDLVTPFGQVADPIADKALIGSALVVLSWYGVIPVWLTVVIMAREIGVTALRFWVIRRAVIAASRGGKIKTAIQIVGIAWCLAPLPAGIGRPGLWIMMVAMVVTVVTGLEYLVRAVRLRRRNPVGTELPGADAAPTAQGQPLAGQEGSLAGQGEAA
jgi:CDP-diacylglycerol---glycerol-3-phosphate 3-phosphatidyltransferase